MKQKLRLFVIFFTLVLTLSACGAASPEKIMESGEYWDADFTDAITEACSDRSKIKSDFLGKAVIIDGYMLQKIESNGEFVTAVGGTSTRAIIGGTLDRDAALSATAGDIITIAGIISEVKRQGDDAIVVLNPAYLIENDGPNELSRMMFY